VHALRDPKPDLSFSGMQNGAHDKPEVEARGRLLGIVRVVVGGQVFDLAVQSMILDQDGEHGVGGFFAENGQLGILVDEAATPPEVKEQIEKGTAEAVRHLSRRFLN